MVPFPLLVTSSGLLIPFGLFIEMESLQSYVYSVSLADRKAFLRVGRSQKHIQVRTAMEEKKSEKVKTHTI